MKKTLLLCSLLLMCENLFSRNFLGLESIIEPRQIVNFPTAGILPKNTFAVNNVYSSFGNTSLGFSLSPFNNFELGISYSATNFIGSGEFSLQTLPSVKVKFRILDESSSFAAIALGFDSQGNGFFDKRMNRFEQLAPGAFLVLSRNFSWKLGLISIHSGLNYSVEENRNISNRLNLFAGIEQTLGSRLSINGELSGNFNDNNIEIGKKKLILNTSIKYAITNRVNFELRLEDLFGNYNRTNTWRRGIALEYSGVL